MSRFAATSARSAGLPPSIAESCFTPTHGGWAVDGTDDIEVAQQGIHDDERRIRLFRDQCPVKGGEELAELWTEPRKMIETPAHGVLDWVMQARCPRQVSIPGF